MTLNWISANFFVALSPVHAAVSHLRHCQRHASCEIHALISNLQSGSAELCNCKQAPPPTAVALRLPPRPRRALVAAVVTLRARVPGAAVGCCKRTRGPAYRFRIMGSGEARARGGSHRGKAAAGRRKRLLTRRQLTAPRKREGRGGPRLGRPDSPARRRGAA